MRLINIEEYEKRNRYTKLIYEPESDFGYCYTTDIPTVDAVSREEYELVCKKLEAAIKDIGNVGICISCKYCDDDDECKKRSEMETDCFEWRGIKEG